MEHKTQNDHFIISYSKFLDLKFMNHFKSLLGSFSQICFAFSIIFGRFITNFVILLIFFKFLFTHSKKCPKTQMEKFQTISDIINIFAI